MAMTAGLKEVWCCRQEVEEEEQAEAARLMHLSSEEDLGCSFHVGSDWVGSDVLRFGALAGSDSGDREHAPMALR